jgi:bifunctional non-homologous end joining protein LigD
MALQEPLQIYREKRDFSSTPEPRGKSRTKTEHGLYIIQKHAASHLHYDFRLELDGVLKSWAVPKGPSFDPSDKRLARQVEDHPVEYGSFEGTIPKGEYGGGTVLLWDRGHWEPDGDPNEGYRRGKLKFRLQGEKLRGGFTLVRMRGNERNADDANWLLIKERDATAKEGDILAERPESVLSGRTIEEIAADPDAAQWRSNRTRAETKPAPHGQAKAAKKRVKAAKRPAEAKPESRRKAAATKETAGRPEIEGARRAPMPEAVEVQLATLVTEPPKGDRWLYEMKLDGYRLLAFVKDGEVRLMTRRGQDWSHRFPTVAEAVRALPVEQAVLDGEVVVLRPDGVSDFQALQNVLREGKGTSLFYFVFDLLYRDGFDLRGAPLLARKEALRGLLAGHTASARLRYSDHLEIEGSEIYSKACALGVEGVVAKEKSAPYLGGRGGSWLKIKCSQRQELVIGGFTEPSGSRLGLGALLMGYHDDAGQLVYAGKVGTGLSGKVLRELRARLSKLERSEAPFARPPRMRGVHWTKPEVVAEIRFACWTRGDRVRQAAFMGIREDREAKTVVRETPRPPPPARSRRPVAPAVAAARGPEGAKGAKRPKQPKKAAHGKAAAARADQAAAARVEITHPDKVLYPELGITKRAVADYYARVAPAMLPLVARRPLTLVRCPGGQGKPCFFQKHEMQGLTDDIGRVPVTEDKGKQVVYLYIETAAALVSLVQLGALEIHTWGSHIDALEKPDLLVFDLDPGPGVEWPTIVEAASMVRELLDALGLRSFVKTTGGKGLHVTVPILPERDWDEVKPFTKAVATALERVDPKRYVASMAKAKRTGKVFVDYLRNGRGATAVVPYSTRARPDGHVAMPLSWDELDDSVSPATFTIESVPEWLARRGDPWAELPSVRQSLTDAMMRKIGA